jgi:tight adherence protein B
MNLGLIAIALIFLSLALLVFGQGEIAARRRRTESRLEAAMSNNKDPLRIETDPLKKKFVPQWITDNLISAGLQPNQVITLRIGAILAGPALILWIAKGPANAVGALLLCILGRVVTRF